MAFSKEKQKGREECGGNASPGKDPVFLNLGLNYDIIKHENSLL